MRPAVAIAILAALPVSAALADVYRSVDAQGHVLYSDTPTPGAELVRVTNRSYAATSPASSTPKSSAAPKVSAADADLARDAAARTVHSDVAKAGAEACKKAQDAYQQIVNTRRIYTTDSNGERQYLSDAEADQARVSAKLQVDEACKDQPAGQSGQ
jgi:hypothetical protein